MAQIVYGFGSSHGPLLSTAPEKWDLRAAADRKNPAHAYRGGTYTFDELKALRREERLEREIEIDVRRARHERNQRALDRLAETFAAVDPDILVVVGDDQHEWFHAENQPSFSIYCGDSVVNTALDEKERARIDPGLAIAMSANHPPEDHVYPVPSGLARAIVERCIEDEFDVATSAAQPRDGTGAPIGIGHAVGFIYRRILRDRPVPVVPILLNTFWPPNQPTPRRCYRFGQSIGRAIKDWNGANGAQRVAVCASGGISHFVIDEDFDGRMLQAIKARDTATLFAEPNSMFRSGTSETKNWITVAGIMSETDFAMDLIDYVPCYRSDAGTGNAMAFATWT